MNLGGSIDNTLGTDRQTYSMDRIEDNDGWQVKVSRARNRFDMRKAKLAACSCKGSCSHQGTPAVASSSSRGSICSLDRDSVAPSINAVDQFRGNWEKVSVTVDSGGVD